MACWPRLEASSIRAADHPTTQPPTYSFSTPFPLLLASGRTSARWLLLLQLQFQPWSMQRFPRLSRCTLPSTSDPLYAFFIYSLFLFAQLLFFFFSQPPPQRNIRPLLPKSYYYVACFRPFFSFIACCLWRRQQLCRFQLHK